MLDIRLSRSWSECKKNVFRDGPRKQETLLRRVPDAARLVQVCWSVVQEDRAGIRWIQPGQTPRECAFAAANRTRDCQQRTRCNVERDVLECWLASAGIAERGVFQSDRDGVRAFRGHGLHRLMRAGQPVRVERGETCLGTNAHWRRQQRLESRVGSSAALDRVDQLRDAIRAANEASK